MIIQNLEYLHLVEILGQRLPADKARKYAKSCVKYKRKEEEELSNFIKQL